MPRSRSPATISRASGRYAACSSMPPTTRPSAATMISELPSAWAASIARASGAGRSRPSIVMKRALPTVTVRSSTPTVMP